MMVKLVKLKESGGELGEMSPCGTAEVGEFWLTSEKENSGR